MVMSPWPLVAFHTFTGMPEPAEASRLPPGLYATHMGEWGPNLRVSGLCPPLIVSHNRSHPAMPRVAERDVKVRSSSPLFASHTFTVLSALAEASRLPSGLYATLRTSALCPLKVRSSSPLFASHTLTVSSSLAEASRLPSGLQATLLTL